jgi:hypothetical protein
VKDAEVVAGIGVFLMMSSDSYLLQAMGAFLFGVWAMRVMGII